MKSPNISYILWVWPLLKGFYFGGVNMYPIFIHNKPHKDNTIYTKCTFVYICKQFIFSQELTRLSLNDEYETLHYDYTLKYHQNTLQQIYLYEP